jgi:hypothetical protein
MSEQVLHDKARTAPRGTEREPLELDPYSVYEVVTRSKVEHLAEDVAAIRERVDTLFYLMLASIAIDVLLRLGRAL